MVLPIFLVFGGCCTNVALLEKIIRGDAGSGNVVTFFQFLFVSIEGFIFTFKFGKLKSSVPLNQYVKLVIMFFLVSVANNYALNFNISMPLHMIIRSGSLLANMTLGIILLKRSYNTSKYISVIMITCGIIICTYASHQEASKVKVDKSVKEDPSMNYVFRWLIGVSLLTFALFVSAGMGICQETLHQKFGKHPKEALFFMHVLPLPGFLLLMPNIYNHILILSHSDPILPGVVNFPSLWVYMFLNVFTSYICVRSVFTLTAEYSSLTVTLIVTLRKFLSLVFSIFYFNNPFTLVHWFGTFLVFLGSIIFSDVIRIFRKETEQKKVQ